MASAATIAKRTARHKDALARGTESYVATPEDLAYDLCGYPYSDISMLPPGAEVLEPSAGRNHIVRMILERNRNVHVTAVEPSAERGAEGRPEVKDEWGYPTGYKVDYVTTTFEDYAAANPGRLFDAVVMNPPFVLVDQPSVWIDHVRLAWSMLRPGGRLVSIVPNGFEYRTQQVYKDMRELVGAQGGCEALGPNAFKATGWTGTAMVIWMVKPLGVRDPWRVPTYTGRETPVRVEHFHMGGWGAINAPVQVSEDLSWGLRGDRVMRYMGQCVTPDCRHLTWAFADGQNDPRGPIGTACADPLVAEAYGVVGPSVAMCFYCANDQDAMRAAERFARTLWVEAPAEPIPAPIPDEPEPATYGEPETLFSLIAA